MWYRYQYIATIWFLFAVCLPLVCVRLYVQLTTRVQPWREVLLVFAWLTMLADAIISTLMANIADPGYHRDLPAATEILWSKLYFMDFFTWPLGTSACRVLLLMMYSDLCPRHLFPKIWWLITISWIYVVGAGVGMSLIYTFLICYPEPISQFWSLNSRCYEHKFWQEYMFVGFVLLVIADLLVYIIPLFIIFQLRNLTRIQRIGAAAMFAVGFVNVGSILTTFIVEIVFDTSPSNHLDDHAVSGVRSFSLLLQLPTAIIVLCIPQLRVIGRWRRTVIKSIRSANRETNHPRMVDAATGSVPDATSSVYSERDLERMDTSSKTPSGTLRKESSAHGDSEKINMSTNV